MVSHTGASAAVVRADGLVDVFITGRDKQNRSIIGRGVLDLDHIDRGIQVEAEPVLEPGELGAFDENGVAYPCLVRTHRELWMYYVGWMPSALTPFQNHIGLARQADERFVRVSRAPVVPRTDADYLSLGSCFVMKEDDRWRMWYTAFTSWAAKPADPKHTYLIKYGESLDGINWTRNDVVCIVPTHSGEHSISRPSVVKINDTYHMWFCWKGDHYDLGYATSLDGVLWTRRDTDFTLDRQSFDLIERCYPHVFRAGNGLYMLYSGNGYGREGLGLARAENST